MHEKCITTNKTHQKPLTSSVLSELGFETKGEERSSPCGTIDMGTEVEECKHVINREVSFWGVLALIIFLVSTGKGPITQAKTCIKSLTIVISVESNVFFTESCDRVILVIREQI